MLLRFVEKLSTPKETLEYIKERAASLPQSISNQYFTNIRLFIIINTKSKLPIEFRYTCNQKYNFQI